MGEDSCQNTRKELLPAGAAIQASPTHMLRRTGTTRVSQENTRKWLTHTWKNSTISTRPTCIIMKYDLKYLTTSGQWQSPISQDGLPESNVKAEKMSSFLLQIDH